MKIANEFTVTAPIGRAWELFNDLEQVIPLMPGAQFTGQDGDDTLGKVKIKVGPVTSEFNGKVRFIERDDQQYRAVIDAKGKESRGTGNAAATVTATLHEAGDRTRVTVDTDLKVVGKLAQFGSGMLQQVSEKLLGQFVDSLEAKLAAENAPAPAAEAPVTDAAAATPVIPLQVTPQPEAAPIDLLELAGGTAVKKYLPVVLAGVAVAVIVALIARRGARGSRCTVRCCCAVSTAPRSRLPSSPDYGPAGSPYRPAGQPDSSRRWTTSNRCHGRICTGPRA